MKWGNAIPIELVDDKSVGWRDHQKTGSSHSCCFFFCLSITKRLCWIVAAHLFSYEDLRHQKKIYWPITIKLRQMCSDLRLPKRLRMRDFRALSVGWRWMLTHSAALITVTAKKKKLNDSGKSDIHTYKTHRDGETTYLAGGQKSIHSEFILFYFWHVCQQYTYSDLSIALRTIARHLA